MKKAAKILSIIGIVYGSIQILYYVILLILHQRIAYIYFSNFNNPYPDYFTFDLFKLGFLIGIIMVLVIFVSFLVIAILSFIKINRGSVKKAPHILLIVSGAIIDNPLFIVSGILGLIASARERNIIDREFKN